MPAVIGESFHDMSDCLQGQGGSSIAFAPRMPAGQGRRSVLRGPASRTRFDRHLSGLKNDWSWARGKRRQTRRFNQLRESQKRQRPKLGPGPVLVEVTRLR